MIFKWYIRIHIYISWVFYWFIYLASRQDVVTFRGLFVCLRLATSWFSDSLSWSTSPVKKSNSSLTERFKVRLYQGCLLRLDCFHVPRLFIKVRFSGVWMCFNVRYRKCHFRRNRENLSPLLSATLSHHLPTIFSYVIWGF